MKWQMSHLSWCCPPPGACFRSSVYYVCFILKCLERPTVSRPWPCHPSPWGEAELCKRQTLYMLLTMILALWHANAQHICTSTLVEFASVPSYRDGDLRVCDPRRCISSLPFWCTRVAIDFCIECKLASADYFTTWDECSLHYKMTEALLFLLGYCIGSRSCCTISQQAYSMECLCL